MIQINLQNRNRLTDLESELMVARGKGQLGSLGKSCTHCYIQNGQPISTGCIAPGTLLNVMGRPAYEEVWGRMDTGLCIAESLRCLPDITTLLIVYTPIQN